MYVGVRVSVPGFARAVAFECVLAPIHECVRAYVHLFMRSCLCAHVYIMSV